MGSAASRDAERQNVREDESDRRLDLAGRDGGTVVVRCELGSLGCDTLEDVRDERVEDGHGLVAEEASAR
jgi:hypothetical protein